MVFEQEVSFRVNRPKKKGLRAKISQNGQFLLIKIFLNANFSSAWIVGRLPHTISESSGPDCSDEVSSSLPMIHAEEKLAFEDIFISKNF